MRYLALALVTVASLAVAGCASNPARTFACDHCKEVDVRSAYTVPSYEGPREVGHLTTRDRECPTCRAATVAYERGKEVDAKCKTCGGNRTFATVAK